MVRTASHTDRSYSFKPVKESWGRSCLRKRLRPHDLPGTFTRWNAPMVRKQKEHFQDFP